MPGLDMEPVVTDDTRSKSIDPAIPPLVGDE